MEGPGENASFVLPDGRTLEYWDGGDPDGRLVLFHPGTPSSRVLGRWGHEPAVSAGVRLVSVSRPGYGGSTMATSGPSLLSTGRDTAALATHLGQDEYAVFGVSGGGPYALATAVADPDHIRALGVVGGIGPWRILEGPSFDPEGSVCLDMLDKGDAAGAWECMRGDAQRGLGSLAAEPDDERLVDSFMGELATGSDLLRDPAFRAIWAANLREVLGNLDGYTLDNLAWGAVWDVKPDDVEAPTMLWYGDADDHCPPRHGRWIADRIQGSELVVWPGDGHLATVDAHWPEVLAGLLSIWK